MRHRSTLVCAAFAASAAVLLTGARSAYAETVRPAQSAQHPGAAELALGACRLERWSEARDLLRAVEREQRRPAEWLCLARAQFHLGQWVAALDSYDELLESDPTRSRSIHAIAATERRELEQRLGWIQIVTSVVLPASVSLSLDGEVISPARVGVAFPVQPGTHALRVEVGGEVQQVERWRIAQGEHRTIGVSIPASERAVTPSDAAQRQPKQQPSARSVRAEPSALQRWAKGTLIGGGVAIAGGVGLVWASGGSRSRDLLYAGFGSGALGGLSLLTGAGLYLAHELGGSAPGEAPEPRRVQVQPWVLSDGAGTAVSGSF
jgi:hypothetical protein